MALRLISAILFTLTAALARMEREIKRERITGSLANRRAAGPRPGRAAPHLHRYQSETARHLIDADRLAINVARDLGISWATLYRRIPDIEAKEGSEANKLGFTRNRI